MTKIKITEAQLKNLVKIALDEQQTATSQPPKFNFKSKAGVEYKTKNINSEDSLAKFVLTQYGANKMYQLLKQLGLDLTSSFNEFSQSLQKTQASGAGTDATTTANQNFVKFAVKLPKIILDIAARFNLDGRSIEVQNQKLLGNLDRMYSTDYFKSLPIFLENAGVNIQQFWGAMSKLVNMQRKAIGA